MRTHVHMPTSASCSAFEYGCVRVGVIISVIIRVAFKWVLKSLESERAADLPMNP